MEIKVITPYGRLITVLNDVDINDKIIVILLDINKDKTEIYDEQYLILRDKLLDPENKFVDYDIKESTILFYTKNKNEITRGFLNCSVFFRDFYYGTDENNITFLSRNKRALKSPEKCLLCSNHVFSTIIYDFDSDKTFYGNLCYQHIPPVPLRDPIFNNYYDMITNKHYEFNFDINKWQPIICNICNKDKYYLRIMEENEITNINDICIGHENNNQNIKDDHKIDIENNEKLLDIKKKIISFLEEKIMILIKIIIFLLIILILVL